MLGSNLVKLPTELLHDIINQLSTADILSLRLTCQMLNSFVSPVLFRSLKLHRDRLAATSEISSIVPYVRNLKMSWPWPGNPAVSLSEGETEDNVEAEDVEVIHLVSFIKKLQNLQSVTWDYCSSYYSKTSDMYLRQVERALAGIPSLKDVNLEILHYSPEDLDPDFSGFKDLYSLHITKRSNSGVAHLLRSVMPAVAASPMLWRLHLITNPHEDNENTSFDSLVHELNIWRSGTTPALQDLRLVGIPMQLSVELRQVFKNLKHLTLAHGTDYDISSCSTMASIAWADVWNALYDAGRSEGLWLETLDTEGVQPEPALTALFKYLRSHPGLRKLSIHRPPYDRFVQGRDPVNDEDQERETIINQQWATQFWCEIIPRYAHSLQALSVVPPKKGPWSYCPNASTAIRQCTLLRELEISVSDVDEDWAREKAADFEMKPWQPASTSTLQQRHYWEDNSRLETVVWGRLPTCPVLLAGDLGSLPLLEKVRITAAERDRNWGWCGTGRMEQRQVLLWQTQKTLEQFVLPPGYPHKLVGNDAIIEIQGI